MKLDHSELSEIELFRGVPEETLDFILERTSQISLAPGEVLLSPKEENQYIYILLSGSVSLHFGSPDSPEIRKLEAGSSIGMISFIDKSKPTAYVVASDECRLLPIHHDLLHGLLASTNTLANNILQMMTNWTRFNTEHIIKDQFMMKELSENSYIDGLTDIYNRRWLDSFLSRLLKRSITDDLSLSILFLDVDKFKIYNDTHGHIAGDCALIALSNVLKKTSRPYDYLTRYGGEEFLIILQNTYREGGIIAAERIRTAVQKEVIHNKDGTELPGITVSMGLATSNSDSTVESLIKEADANLYKAKAEGRNRVCY